MYKRALVVLLSAFIFSLPSTTLAQSDPPLLLRFPSVSKTQIVFTYANDLWIVGRDGGEARHLTSGVGVEALPHFSPDGSMIAFTGEYDGNRDVYVVPATGGSSSAIDLSSRGRVRRGLDSRWQEDPLQLLGQELHAL